MSPNTLEQSRYLEGNGFIPSEVEGIVEIEALQNSDLVTKDFLRVEMADLKAELRPEMAD